MSKFQSRGRMALAGACVSVLCLHGWAESPTWALSLESEATDGKGTIRQGDWTFPVTVVDGAAKTLRLGRYTSSTTVGDLDLRGPIGDGSWKIIGTENCALEKLGVAKEEEITGTIYMPTTLLSLGTDVFQEAHMHLVIDAPGFSGEFPRRNLFMYGGILRLKLPKVTTISVVDFGWTWSSPDNYKHGGLMAGDTDATDWDFSGVTSITWNEKTASGQYNMFNGKAFKGNLKLPSLTRGTRSTFANCSGMTGLELGTFGTLTMIESNTVASCAKLTDLKLGGVRGGFVVSNGAFRASALAKVTFASSAPQFAEPSGVVFGTATTPALQMTFFIPPSDMRDWDLDWKPIVRSARAATDAEKDAFAAVHGTEALPRLIGVVGPDVFRTAGEQFLATADAADVQRHKLSAELFDTRWADTDSVTVVTPPGADGRYAHDSVVEIRVTTTDGAFGKWRGGVPVAQERDATLFLKMDRDYTLQANVFHPWMFRPNATPVASGTTGTISNRHWRLNVKVQDAAKRTLGIGTADGDGTAYTGFGGGSTLDLNGKVLTEDGETEYTINWIYASALSNPKSAEKIDPYQMAQRLVFPETLSGDVIAGGQRLIMVWDHKITELYIECPNVTGTLARDFLSNLTGKLSLRAPKVTGLGGVSVNMSLLASTDVTGWDLSGATTLEGLTESQWGVFHSLLGRGDSMDLRQEGGDLDMPKLKEVQKQAFANAKNLTRLTLATNRTDGLTSIGDSAFKGCTALRQLTMKLTPSATVAENAFLSTPNLRDVTLLSAPPADVAVVDRMLAGVDEAVVDSVRPMILDVRRSNGWRKGCLPGLVEPTDAELAGLPARAQGIRLLGVWQTASGAHKAWVVDSTRGLPKGLVLMVR